MRPKLAVTLIALAALAAPGVASANAITDWNRTMIDALETANTPPPVAARTAATVQAAVFDAVNGVNGHYRPIHMPPGAPPGASRPAAGIAAAHEALVALFPAQQAMLDERYSASLAQLGGGNDQSVARGLAWGTAVADEILAWRAGDGFFAVLPPYVPAGVPGRWNYTPPNYGPPLFRQFASMAPFALTSPAQFLPAGPPPLTSARYTQDFNEVKELGSVNSTARTPEETQTAMFWQDDTPAAMWNRVADELADSHGTGLTQEARLLAKMNVALADATIAIWNAKNVFDTWRPITAIQQADSDGNPDTIADPNWSPLLPTPQFQEYPSAHSGVSSAATGILASFYGDETAFRVLSFHLQSVERDFTSFSAAVAQVVDARIFAGFHFRFSCDDAVVMSSEVADYVDRTVAVRTRGGDD